MAPVYAQHLFVWDYLQNLLWGLAFIALVAAWFFVRRLPSWFRAMRGRSWPMVQGTIESTSVTAFAEQSLAQLAYSYHVEGELYSGYFTQQFADEQEAWDYVRPLKGQSIFVRYQPVNHEVSAFRVTDQNPLLFAKRASFLLRFLRSSIALLTGTAGRDLSILLGTGNWPLSKGKIESGIVVQKREREFWYLISYYVCEIGYSYTVGGEYYSGYFERTFFSKKAAQKFSESLKGRDVMIRYKRNSPDLSVLRRQDQPTVQLA